MSLIEIRSAIIDDLKIAGLGDAVEPHPGRLTVDDLTKFVPKGRASIRVAQIGLPRVNTLKNVPALETAWAVYIIAYDKQGTPRDETAMTLSTAVVQQIIRNLWGREDLDDPTDIRADNLYSGAINQRAVALWAVSWKQEWTPKPVDFATLDDLLRVDTDFDVAEGDGEPALHDTTEIEGGS